MADAEKTTRPFVKGDMVRNTNPASIHHGRCGTFQRTHEKWTFPTGLACDVLIAGGYGPYGCEDVIMSVSDLEPVEKSEGA